MTTWKIDPNAPKGEVIGMMLRSYSLSSDRSDVLTYEVDNKGKIVPEGKGVVTWHEQIPKKLPE